MLGVLRLTGTRVMSSQVVYSRLGRCAQGDAVYKLIRQLAWRCLAPASTWGLRSNAREPIAWRLAKPNYKPVLTLQMCFDVISRKSSGLYMGDASSKLIRQLA